MLPADILHNKLMLSRDGDIQSREDLITAYRSFILKTAVKACGRHLEWGVDDELSIGLMAFNEAVDRFDEDRGVPFPAFARLIIKSRVTDFLRRQVRHSAHSGGSLDNTDTQLSYLEWSRAWEEYLEQETARERAEEIREYKELIASFEISFADLVKASPRHRDARANLQEAARKLAGNEEMFSRLMTTKKLPVMELSRLAGVSVKTIERGRRYIIATSLLWHFCEDFIYLCSFIKPSGRGTGADD
ncbi:MAG: RNA polymerase sigma-I factor [Bacillota bacterium]